MVFHLSLIASWFLLILLLVIIIILFRKRWSIKETWKRLPSWTRNSMKTAFLAVAIIFSLALILSIFSVFRNNFSCSTGMFFGLSSGGSSLGACFAWPMLFFYFIAIPVAIAGAIVGAIVDIIQSIIRKSKSESKNK